MDLNNFLKIYERPFHKLKFIGVKFVGEDKNPDGRSYYRFCGVFKCVPSDDFLMVSDPNGNKAEILNLLHELSDEYSAVYTKKLTKKLVSEEKNINWVFRYCFDFAPKNIIDYKIDVEKGLLYLRVLGYGQFQ